MVVLEKTLESPLDFREIQPVHPKGNQSWIFIGRTDAEAETPIFGHLMWRADSFEKDPDAGKGWRQEEKGTTEDEMVGRHHHRLDGHEFESSPGVGDRRGGLACWSPWGRRESDTTEWLTDYNKCTYVFEHIFSYFLIMHQFSSTQSLSRVRLFATPWTTAHQASLSIADSWSLPKVMSIESVMPSNHLILCRPLLLLPSIFPSIRVFFKWISSSHQVAKVLEFQPQHQSFQWIFRTDFL